MIKEIGSCCEPDKEEREYSKACEIVFDVISDLFWKIRRVDGKEKQEKMALELFKKLSDETDMSKFAEKVLEYQKNIKVKEIKADDKDPEKTENEADNDDVLGMFEELD